MFTQAKKEELINLIGLMVLKNMELSLPNIPSIKTVIGVVVNTSVPTLKIMHDSLEALIKREKGNDKWKITNIQSENIKNMELWLELIYLSVLYHEHLAEEKAAKAKVNKLRKEIANLKDMTTSPEQKLNEKLAELKGLEEAGY